MKVLEIGGGATPGPYFAEADEYFALEADAAAVRQATAYAPDITHMVGDAIVLSRFADESMDIVLARNVLSDPALGVSEAIKHRSLKLYGGDLDATQPGTTEAVFQRKTRIVAEAGRLLKASGVFVAFEQHTPLFGREFFERLPELTGGLIFERGNLSHVMPMAYSLFHLSSINPLTQYKPQTWIGRKAAPNS